MNEQALLSKASFRAARPVWPAGRETEKNLFVGFSAQFSGKDARGRATLRLAVSSCYRAFLNGKFLGCGPARAAHGFFRIDEWDLSGQALDGLNTVAIEAAGYNVSASAYLNQPAFLQAEIVSDSGQVLAATGTPGQFSAALLPQRVQKAARYSFQRPFSEYYRLTPDWSQWRTRGIQNGIECAEFQTPQLLPRRVAYPKFGLRQPVKCLAAGRIERGPAPEKPWMDRFFDSIGPKLGGYTLPELDVFLPHLMECFSTHPESQTESAYDPRTAFTLERYRYRLLDLGTNLSGFLGARITCSQPVRLVIAFDEVLTGGDVNWKRMHCHNLAGFELAPGCHMLETFEPYTLRYLKLMVLEGAAEIQGVCLREYANPDVWSAHFACSDTRFNRIFAAGRETFSQNTVDIFMDCPSRERAGWLCDSFFMGRAERVLSGANTVEDNFLENYALPAAFEHVPPGMLPMCYPADHYDGGFIPNWALWFVLELEEHQARGGSPELAAHLKPRVLALFDYFKRFQNSDGLLEKLEGWIFIEWSEAKKFVQDVNFPTNMLYAGALDAAGRLYNLPELRRQASELRHVIQRVSFDGQFFVDNALRQDGRLAATRNRSEVCQYYAFYFDAATPETHAELWKMLAEEFGPRRAQTNAWPEIHAANAFIGNVLRLELLSRYGRSGQVLQESQDYLGYMAERTGTLWENQKASASCNHGFASHICHVLCRDALGVKRVDPVKREVHLRFGDVPLQWCEGSFPAPDGRVDVYWRREDGRIQHRCSVPAGYTVHVEMAE